MGIRKISIILFLVGVAKPWVSAQVTIQQLLDAVRNDYISENSNTYQNNIRTFPQRWHWLDKFDIRTETDRMQTSRQEFLVRTSFHSIKRKKHELAKFKSTFERKMAELASERYELLYDSYQKIVEIIELQSLQTIRNQQYLLYKKVDSLYGVSLSAGEKIDLADFIKTKEKLFALEKEILEDKLSLQNQIKDFELLKADSVLTDILVTAAEMKARIEKGAPDIASHPEVKSLDLKSQVLQSELEIEKSKNNKILDFTQLRYSVREDLLLENRFSVSAGFSIPWRGSSSYRYHDILYKQAEAILDSDIKKAEINENITKKVQEFQHIYQLYTLSSQEDLSGQWKDTKSKIINSGRLDVKDIILIQQYELDQQSRTLEYYHQLLQVYIDILYHNGSLNSTGNILYRQE